MPWSASEQDSGVDSRKPRIRGMAIKKDSGEPSMPGNFFAVYT
jgi:hypothetical protein